MTRNQISRTSLLIAAATLTLSGALFAQTPAPAATDAAAAKPEAKAAAKPETKPDSKAQAPDKVFHPGGRHDQRGHEATLRAKAAGQRMQEPVVHPGGKHDEAAHKAAIRADQKDATK